MRLIDFCCSKRSRWIISMSESAALNRTRVVARVALSGLLGIWLAGCSSDATRLSDAFSNPFATSSNQPPTPNVNVSSNASPQADANYAAAAHPSPVAVAALPPPAPASTGAIAKATTTQPITGFGDGWRAAGGSPIVVADGDTLDAISRRYGVPQSALLRVNGFTDASQVHGGVRLIVPVYDAIGKTAAADAPGEAAPKAPSKASVAKKVAEAQGEERSPKAKSKLAKAKLEKEKSTKDKLAKDKDKPVEDKLAKEKLAQEKRKPAEAAAEPVAKPAAAKASKPSVVAKADNPPQPAAPAKKKPAAPDTAPTGSVHADAPAPGPALTGAQADAAGATPEFRWPARGRIIQGFKAGGNDGINIAVPEGTSVKAAEAGVVAYAGSELKGYGNLVLIRHPNGFVSAYANNGELEVKRGETVKRGQIIAKSGQSGNVSSPQLHFELRKGSTPVDPTSYLAGL
jgi:murein DD-endopeptidase MepM/ murein hydrolase activator NlpD